MCQEEEEFVTRLIALALLARRHWKAGAHVVLEGSSKGDSFPASIIVQQVGRPSVRLDVQL